MKIIFSRKGFDSSAGGAPSPIVGGRPVSLPIPAGAASRTSYDDLGLGDLVERATRAKLSRDALCHHDPMFTAEGECFFGQCGAAQSHLANRGVGVGDLFLFFGLFTGAGGERHHRIFGYMKVARLLELSTLGEESRRKLVDLSHPHALAMHSSNDVVYQGPGRTAGFAHAELCLTVPGARPSLWQVPDWLGQCGLSYHDRASRWLGGNRLQSVARGQEFVSDIGELEEPRRWLDRVIELIGRDG
jgi:hypothetical protein